MNIILAFKGDTLKVSPLKKRDRLPDKYKVVIDEQGVAYAITSPLFGEKILLGTIPAGYKMVSKDKYEIVFKTANPPKRSKRYSK